jgi:hypothetical protein
MLEEEVKFTTRQQNSSHVDHLVPRDIAFLRGLCPPLSPSVLSPPRVNLARVPAEYHLALFRHRQQLFLPHIHPATPTR